MSKHLTAFFMLLCITSLFISPATYAKSKERLGINKQGIKVWTYQTKDNPMLEYRAETTLNTTLENATGLILDVERGKKWIPYMSDIQVIERDDKAGEFIIYCRMDFPFPLNDRDVVIQGNYRKDSYGRIIINNKAINDPRVPIKNNVIRISDYEGDWIVTKLSAKQVKVTTSGFADPAGAIPTSFVNTFVEQQPYQMLQRMKDQVKAVNYTLKDLPSVLK